MGREHTVPDVKDRETDRRDAITRRRAAQRDWHTARSRMERTAEALTVAIVHASRNVVGLRSRLEEAQRGEREARSSYQRVAHDTSTQLSRLLRRGVDRSA
jgi:hypothetical protein